MWVKVEETLESAPSPFVRKSAALLLVIALRAKIPFT
jgi:hypothetical protein